MADAKNNPGARPPTTEGSQAQTSAPTGRTTRLLAGLCAIQFALLIGLVMVAWGPWHSGRRVPGTAPSTSNPAPAAAGDGGQYLKARPGPWGNLEYTRINIEPPDEFVQQNEPPFSQTRWFFPHYTRLQLRAFLETCELTAAHRAELLNSASWQEETNGIVVTPSQQLVFELQPETRAQIYTVLGGSGQNDFYNWPCVFRRGGFDDWFEESRLSNTTLSLARRLVYQRGSTLCFSDVPEILSRVPDPAERKRLLKTLTRRTAILMKLRITPDTDVAALEPYWSKGGRAKDIGSLLESLTSVPGGVTIDVVHLLPPFARKRLNTYPNRDSDGPETDCFWTSMNFFNDPPDKRYYDEAVGLEEIKRDYKLVAEPAFGDLVFLMRPDGMPIHVAVYIADDVVFTKDGANERQPWLLAKMDDLLACYLRPFPLTVKIYRSNKR